MKKFAVAWLSAFENEIELYIVEAENWRDALEKAKPGYIESAMTEAFNQDWNFNVIEIH